MAGILTLFFTEGAQVDETGAPVESRSMPVLGTFVEGNALIAGVSPEVTAIFPLHLLKSAVYQEVLTDEADSGDDNRSEQSADEGRNVYIPNFGGGSGSGEERSE